MQSGTVLQTSCCPCVSCGASSVPEGGLSWRSGGALQHQHQQVQQGPLDSSRQFSSQRRPSSTANTQPLSRQPTLGPLQPVQRARISFQYTDTCSNTLCALPPPQERPTTRSCHVGAAMAPYLIAPKMLHQDACRPRPRQIATWRPSRQDRHIQPHSRPAHPPPTLQPGRHNRSAESAPGRPAAGGQRVRPPAARHTTGSQSELRLIDVLEAG